MSHIMIQLIPYDGKPIKISETAARQSETLKDILDNVSEGNDIDIPIPNVQYEVLKKIVEYCEKHGSNDSTIIYDMLFLDQPETMVKAIGYASHYLMIEPLTELTAKETARFLERQSTAKMKEFLDIYSDEED